MNNSVLSRQEKEVYTILKRMGSQGMNSFQWRQKFVQLPARIHSLKHKGYQITTRRRANGSVDYLLISSPFTPKPESESNVGPIAWTWEYTPDGVARKVPTRVEPEQQSLI